MKKKLSIALFSTPWESVPPAKYGGTELVVYNLAEGLIKRGHRVTVFATGDSTTSAQLKYAHRVAGYRAGIPWGNELFSLVHASYAFREVQTGEFDIVHNHYDIWGFAFEKFVNTPCVSTYHRDLTHINETEDFELFKKLAKDARLVSISKSQEESAPIKLNWIANVYNGIDINAFEYNETPEDYLVWISRITPHKGAKEAIEAAREAGKKIILAGKIDQFKENDVAYFERDIRPLLDGDAVRYVGEVDHATKVRILKNARGFIFPIQWNEPFGLVMIEAMACGTPVVAHRRGSVPEVVADGKTGFITETRDDLVSAIHNLPHIERRACRALVEQKFSSEAMTLAYENVYRSLL